MPDVEANDMLRALADCYRATTTAVTSLSADAFDLPTRCEGRSVRDVLFHPLLDAQRALVAFASPATEDPTTDLVEYWRPYRPGSEGAARRATRSTCAGLPPLTHAPP